MERSKFKIIYVHGFGGQNTYPNQIYRQTSILSDYKLYPDTLTVYDWDSEKLSLNISKSWKNALKKCEYEVKNFIHFLEKTDGRNEKFYIIAFSLGTQLVLDALSQLNNPLKNLAHVFLLAGAASEHYNLSQININKKTKIINYHSPKRDLALSLIYKHKQNESAIGAAGFKDHSHYPFLKQYTVNRVHASIHYDDLKDSLPETLSQNRLFRTVYSLASNVPQKIAPSYDTFADSLVEKIAYKEGWRNNIGGHNKSILNIENYTIGGEYFWDNICSNQYDNQLYKIQKNIHTNHYRILKNNRRILSDTNLEVILNHLKKNLNINILDDLYP